MLKKQYLKSKPVCKVTFEVPKAVGADQAYLVGDFNGWDAAATPMRRLKDGRHTVTLKLDAGQEYQFRYKLDGIWDNDWQADLYTVNPYGGENSVISTHQ
ncbi:isoamylase early set domain-containing protein [Chloroflexota bacterium]